MRLTPPQPFLAAALASMIPPLAGAAVTAGDTSGAAHAVIAHAATAQGNVDDRVLPQESKLGIDALLSRETARMRESLASAVLGSDHSMLLARKRSTDWSFLAAAVTARIGAGIEDPQQLLSSIIECDASTQLSVSSRPMTDDSHPGWPARCPDAAPLVAEVVTCMSDPSGCDFPCAIGWRVVHDARGLVARALWHEPMMPMRGIDAPLVPDRTMIRLDARVTHVECWGFGSMTDVWPAGPEPLDQLGDSYDFADAARHWWWTLSRGPRAGDACGLHGTAITRHELVQLPECEVVRVSPWQVGSLQKVTGEAARDPDTLATADSSRGSIAVPLRASPSHAHVDWDAANPSGPTSLRITWNEDDRCRAALRWRALAPVDGARSGPIDAPDHGWLDAQARLQLLQHVPTPTVLPEPYSTSLIRGDGVPEPAAHARATANVWQAAITGNCTALADALSDAEVLRRRRGLPRSMDAMALAALAESLVEHGAPERSVALVVTRHLLVATALPPDRAAANAESAESDLMPPVSRADYAQMLRSQGRWWASAHCTSPDAILQQRHEASGDEPAAADPLVTRLNDWLSARHLLARGGTGAPAAIQARTLATSSAEGLSPSGGMASSSSTGRVRTARSELASGSPAFTMVRPFLCWPTSDAGSSSLMPAFDLPRPWHSKHRDSKNGTRSAYVTAPTSFTSPESGDAGTVGPSPAAGCGTPCDALSCEARSAAHRARVT